MGKHTVKRSKEYREQKSILMSELQKKCKEEGTTLHKKGTKHSPEASKRHKAAGRRLFTNRCPFTMVDGIRTEMQKMNRYNTHSGVLTESEAGVICGL